MNKNILLSFCLIATWAIQAQQAPTQIKPYKSHHLSITETSDICYAADRKSFFIVSDDGFLFETDLEGNVLRKSPVEGTDYEGVWYQDGLIYVVEERHRRILAHDVNTLKPVKTVTIPYQGGRNKSYESITYNPVKKRFIILTEKDPIHIYELDQDFRITHETRFEHKVVYYKKFLGLSRKISYSVRDISAATWFQGHLYLLSDEDRLIMKLNPDTYEVISTWQIPIVNPEGIVFLPDGEMRILSDDREMMYYFKPLF